MRFSIVNGWLVSGQTRVRLDGITGYELKQQTVIISHGTQQSSIHAGSDAQALFESLDKHFEV